MKPDLTTDVANLLSFAGTIITHLRSHGWSTQDSEHQGAYVGEIVRLADATHNLHHLGVLVAQFQENPAQWQSPLVEQCRRLIGSFEGYLAQIAKPDASPVPLSSGARSLRETLRGLQGAQDAPDTGSGIPNIDRMGIEADFQNAILFLEQLAAKIENYEVNS